MNGRGKSMSRADEATDWAARIDRGPLDADAQRALDGWVAADERNRGMLLRAQAMLCMVDEADETLATRADSPAPSATPDRPLRRWWWRGGLPFAAAAAGVAALITLQPERARYTTETGEIRRVAMDDGSRAIINTDTHVDTEIDRGERLVAIDRGEAWFDVAKDADRPFIVSAGPIRVRATGTAFAVRRDADAATVTVTEGAVEIWNVASPDRAVPARAGQSTTVAFAPAPGVRPRVIMARESALAWRDGDIVLEGMTLDQAVAEFNRYNLRQIRLATPHIGKIQMLGYFRSNQPEQFARAAAGIVNGNVEQHGNNIVISSQQYRNKNFPFQESDFPTPFIERAKPSRGMECFCLFLFDI